MPSIAAANPPVKTETKAVLDVPESFKAASTVVEKKCRNLEKRKVRNITKKSNSTVKPILANTRSSCRYTLFVTMATILQIPYDMALFEETQLTSYFKKLNLYARSDVANWVILLTEQT